MVVFEASSSQGLLHVWTVPPIGGAPTFHEYFMESDRVVNDIVYDPVNEILVVLSEEAFSQDRMHVLLYRNTTNGLSQEEEIEVDLPSPWGSLDAYREDDGGILLLASGPPQCPVDEAIKVWRLSLGNYGYHLQEVPIPQAPNCASAPIEAHAIGSNSAGKLHIGFSTPTNPGGAAGVLTFNAAGTALANNLPSLSGLLFPRAVAFSISDSLAVGGQKGPALFNAGNLFDSPPNATRSVLGGNTCVDIERTADTLHRIYAFNRVIAPMGRLRMIDTANSNPVFVADFQGSVVGMTATYTDSYYGSSSPTASGRRPRLDISGQPQAGLNWVVRITGGPATVNGTLHFGTNNEYPTVIPGTNVVKLHNNDLPSIPFTLDLNGNAILTIPIASSSEGLLFYAQATLSGTSGLIGATSGFRAIVQ